MPSDTERLDWLEEHIADVDTTMFQHPKSWELVMRETEEAFWGNTLRAAIDAAIRSQSTIPNESAPEHKSYCATTVKGAEDVATCTCGAVVRDGPHDGE